MTIQIPSDVAGALASHVASGEFASPEDALRAAVNLLDQAGVRRRQLEELRQSLIEAEAQIERGEFVDAEQAFDEVEIELFGHRLADQ